MDDEALLRYSRHILLDEIGIEGQERLNAAHALIVGAGGLGSPAAMYLASAGVGHLTVVDPDTVDLTNLQRQIAHSTERVGQPKVESLRTALHALNPRVELTMLQTRVDDSSLPALVAQADVVLDCCDNYSTRHALNAACVRQQKPLVSGAAIRFDGQLAVFDPRRADSPCYACAFAPDAQPPETQCATMGVFAPLVGIVGAMQAAEALKLLLGIGDTTAGRYRMFDALTMAWSEMRLPRQARCPVCGPQQRP
jgi:molybdopterin-synthase adenylyltransferase